MRIKHAPQPGWEDTDEEGVIQTSEVEEMEHVVVGGEIPDRTAANTWTGAQRGAVAVLASDTVIAPNFAAANNFQLTLDANALLANPTALVPGQSGVIVVTQDEIGGRTLVFGSKYVFPRGVAPMLSGRPGSVDYLIYYVETADRIAILTKGELR